MGFTTALPGSPLSVSLTFCCCRVIPFVKESKWIIPCLFPLFLASIFHILCLSGNDPNDTLQLDVLRLCTH